MEKRELVQGDVLQLHLDHKFGGMLVVVDEPKSWGCQGCLLSSREFEATKYKGRTFVRPKFEEMEFVGKVVWYEVDSGEFERE
jgi:hypothetical protein